MGLFSCPASHIHEGYPYGKGTDMTQNDMKKNKYWRIFMVANPFFAIAVISLILYGILDLWVGVVIALIGFFLMWQFLLKRARKECAVDTDKSKKKH